jgi:antitoxin MazE
MPSPIHADARFAAFSGRTPGPARRDRVSDSQNVIDTPVDSVRPRLKCLSGLAFAAVAKSVRRSYTVITVATKTRIVKIGNSRGIRIPKTLLDEADLPEEVELHAQPGRLVVQAARRPRSGWAAAAKRMRARGDDRLLDESTSTKFDREEWEWR